MNGYSLPEEYIYKDVIDEKIRLKPGIELNLTPEMFSKLSQTNKESYMYDRYDSAETILLTGGFDNILANNHDPKVNTKNRNQNFDEGKTSELGLYQETVRKGNLLQIRSNVYSNVGTIQGVPGISLGYNQSLIQDNFDNIKNNKYYTAEFSLAMNSAQPTSLLKKFLPDLSFGGGVILENKGKSQKGKGISTNLSAGWGLHTNRTYKLTGSEDSNPLNKRLTSEMKEYKNTKPKYEYYSTEIDPKTGTEKWKKIK
ncbi:MAG: hypothetical protein SFU98_16740 [Leptospiraceae bacterium]|nr:hypothetical protein [Leptospiraceae bacterium]